MMEQVKKLFQAVDMTVGEPWKKIVIFTIPMLLGNIAQQLYNTVDSIVVGKYVGDNALAAVGSAGPILNLLLVLFVGISMGASIMVSQYFGAKQREELSQTIGNCITLTAIAVAIIMVLSVIIVRPLLELLDTPESITDWCTSYLLIMFLGSVGSAYYNILSGILRGLGDAFSALIYLLVATVLNIILDLVFVAKLGMGASIMVSQYFGAKQREELSQTIGNCITLTAIAVAIIMVLSVIIVRPLLELLDTPESITDWCTSYLLIMFLGSVGSAYYNILSGILRGLGDAFSALIYLLVATVLNIILDLVFVAKLGMGVSGVAWATIIAQAVSAVLCFRRLAKLTDIFDMKPQYLKMNKSYAKKIIKLGLPSGLTQAILSMAMIIVQSLTNSFGEMFIAANVIVMRVDGFAMLPNFSFGTAMTTYAGQNVGARAYDRVTKGAKQGTLIAVFTTATITGMILLFGKQLMGIFTNTTELVDLARNMMGIIALGYIAMAVTQSLSGVMRGAGDTMTPMWISIVTTVIVRVPIAYGIAYLTRTAELPNGRQECIFISLLCSWLFGAIVTTIFYLRGNWKKKALN